MSLVQEILELLWPTRCVICDTPGCLVCSDCLESLPRIDLSQACPQCGMPQGVLECIECQGEQRQADPFVFSKAVAVYDLSGASIKLVTAYKDGGERRMSQVLAHLLAQQIPPEWILWANCCTYVPADEGALRKRDFDHMALVAQAFAQETGLSCARMLEKRGGKDQRSLGRMGRAQNMEEAFVLAGCKQDSEAKIPSPSNRIPLRLFPHILLLDDVMTSGATLNAAAATLLGGGAAEVRVATVLRAW